MDFIQLVGRDIVAGIIGYDQRHRAMDSSTEQTLSKLLCRHFSLATKCSTRSLAQQEMSPEAKFATSNDLTAHVPDDEHFFFFLIIFYNIKN